MKTKAILLKQGINKNRRFYTEKVVGNLTPVFKKSVDDAFIKVDKDIEILDEASASILSDISTMQQRIKSQYESLNNLINKTSTSVDKSALFNMASFANVNIIKESFYAKDDIISDSNVLFNSTDSTVSILPSSINKIKINSFTAESNSNGYFVLPIENAFDSSEFSYLEYEQVPSVNGLTLSIILKTDKSQIINRLAVAVNNMGTQDWIKLKDIQYSISGTAYESVFNNNNLININSYYSESENGFVLKPGYDFGGEHIFNFQPVRAEFIKLIFHQSNINFEENKHKILIKNIALYRAEYTNQGTLTIRKPIDTSLIKTLGVFSRQLSKINSTVAKIKYQISFDNQTYYDISAINDPNGELNQTLTVNSPWEANSIDLKEINSGFVYIRVFLNKEVDSTNLEELLKTLRINEIEYFPYPIDGTPISLKNTPTANTVRLFALPYISIGNPLYNKFQLGNTSQAVTYYVMKVPFEIADNMYVALDTVKIEKFDSLSTLVDGDNIGYFINNTEKLLYINIPKKENYLNPDYFDAWLSKPVKKNIVSNQEADADSIEIGAFLRSNKKIYIVAEHEYVVPSNGGYLDLQYYSDKIKNNTRVWKTKLENGEAVIEPVYDLIYAGDKKIALTYQPHITDEYLPEIIGGYKVDFIDGITEFISSDSYAFSIDKENKILYLKDSYVADVSIKYYRKLETELAQSQFEILPEGNKIYIYPDFYDSTYIYKVEYNVAALIDAGLYVVNGKTIKFSDQEIIRIFYGSPAFANKQIKVEYSFMDTQTQFVDVLKKSLTPILTDISIIYSK